MRAPRGCGRPSGLALAGARSQPLMSVVGRPQRSPHCKMECRLNDGPINMQGLFKSGMTEAAEKQLQAGVDEGWSLNAAVYEQLILGLCQIGNTTEATRMLNRMDVRSTCFRSGSQSAEAPASPQAPIIS